LHFTGKILSNIDKQQIINFLSYEPQKRLDMGTSMKHTQQPLILYDRIFVNFELSLSLFLQLFFAHVNSESLMTFDFSKMPSGRCDQRQFWIFVGIRWSSDQNLWNCQDFGNYSVGFLVHCYMIHLIWTKNSGVTLHSLGAMLCKLDGTRCRSEGLKCTRTQMIHT